MTICKFKSRPTWHQTAMLVQGRCICIAESPHNLLLRLKGTRQVLRLPWSIAYVRAAFIEANVQRLNKINERKARRRVAAKSGR